MFESYYQIWFSLPQLKVCRIVGKDSADFLHRQLTQDINSMTINETRLFAYCNAQGRLLANGLIVRKQLDVFDLIVHASIADIFCKRLKMYVLKSQVQIQIEKGFPKGKLVALPNPEHVDLGLVVPDTFQFNCLKNNAEETELIIKSQLTERHIMWGHQPLFDDGLVDETLPIEELGENARHYIKGWEFANWCDGWVWIIDRTMDQWIPQMLQSEQIGSIHFQKGCYPGQEVVARAQYRGVVKRRLHRLRQEELCIPGDKIENVLENSQNTSSGVCVQSIACEEVLDDYAVFLLAVMQH